MIYQKISGLINKIHFLLSQFTAKNDALMKMYQTPKNSAVGDISRCLNRQDFADDELAIKQCENPAIAVL